MIDNFEQIFNILPDKTEEDLTYYCQIIKRKKDHPGLEGKNNSARLVKPYYFSNRHELEKRWEEMKAIAEVTGARIMIDLFPKHSVKVKYEMLKRLAEIIESDNVAKLHRLYNTCYGSMQAASGRKLWLIDWDFKDTYQFDTICNELSNKMDRFKVDVIHTIPTKQGFHFLVKPFDSSDFIRLFNHHGYQVPDIHKNSPTLLYLPKSIK